MSKMSQEPRMVWTVQPAVIGGFVVLFAAIIFFVIWNLAWISPKRISQAGAGAQLQAERTKDLLRIEATISIAGLLDAVEAVNLVDQRQILSVRRSEKLDPNTDSLSELNLKPEESIIVSVGVHKGEGAAEVTNYYLKLVGRRWVITKKTGWVS